MSATTVWASEHDIVPREHVPATTLPREDFGPRRQTETRFCSPKVSLKREHGR